MLLLLLPIMGMMVAVMITRKWGMMRMGKMAILPLKIVIVMLLLTTAAGAAGLVVLRHSLGRESGCRWQSSCCCLASAFASAADDSATGLSHALDRIDGGPWAASEWLYALALILHHL